MKLHRLIHAGFAAAALSSAALPALAYTVWPDIDFEWYADVGKPLVTTTDETPAPRPGYIWAPGRYVNVGERQEWIPAHWVKDELE